MVQRLTSIPNPDGPLMLLSMTLDCDGCAKSGALFPGGFHTVGEDYIIMRRLAAAEGWRRIHGGVWMCPCCKDYGNESGE